MLVQVSSILDISPHRRHTKSTTEHACTENGDRALPIILWGLPRRMHCCCENAQGEDECSNI